MKQKNAHDQTRRFLCQQYEIERALLKACISDTQLSHTIRELCVQLLGGYSANTSITRVRNRCVMTGRARGILRDFRVSRLQFRRLAAEGKLPGILPAQWS